MPDQLTVLEGNYLGFAITDRFMLSRRDGRQLVSRKESNDCQPPIPSTDNIDQNRLDHEVTPKRTR